METNSIEFLERMLEISRIMAENQDADSLLKYALQTAMELVNAEQGHLILLNDRAKLEFRVSHGSPEEISHSILEKVLINKEPLRITDALSNEDFQGAFSIQSLQLRSIMCVPLVSRDKQQGAVYVENRSNANVFDESHLEVLIFFAKQAAVLIEKGLLNANLRIIREELVITREEERRRIRHDLHSELGPSLAALRLEVDTAQKLILGNVETAKELLHDMQVEVEDILANVRHIVYALRPPALDELGLIPAIQEYIATIKHRSNLQFELEIPDRMPPLSAALEVAIYRISLEVVANAIRRTNVTHCLFRLSADKDIQLEFQDDGQNSPEDTQIRVGISTVRKYVAELGGTFKINNKQGSKIEIMFPLIG